VLFGEDVAKPGGIFGVTRGLAAKYGARVFDTPISETAMLGAAVGAAMMGMRPIVEIMWVDFTLVAMDQIVNQAANIRYVSGGRLSAPLVIRTQQGASPGSCAQHAQNLEALFTHIPGLRVGLVGNAQDAYGMTLTAIACDDPVLLIENRTLYHGEPQDVLLGGIAGDGFGARTLVHGDDITIVSWGAMAAQAAAAAAELASHGIGAEVIDARWLAPFDWDALHASVRKTGRLLVVHEANVTGGFGAEIAARTSKALFGKLKAPVERLGVPDCRIPAATHLHDALIPAADDIAALAVHMCPKTERTVS